MTIGLKQVFLAGLIGVSPLSSVAKAQSLKQFASKIVPEVGVTSTLNKEMALFRGVNFPFNSKNNQFDIFLGAALNPHKKGDFIGMLTNDAKWNKYSNFSSWARSVMIFSKRVKKAMVEVSPVKVNWNAGKFDFSVNPAIYAGRDFKAGEANLGLSAIFQTRYSVSTKDKLLLEVRYASEPAEKFKNIKFENGLDNTSYRITYKRYF